MGTGMPADRRRQLRRHLAEIRARLRRPCDAELFDALLTEGASIQAELAAAPPQPARRPWKGPPPQRMRIKRQRMAWTGTRPAGYARDPGRR